MDGYELGKDIKGIIERLTRIENLLTNKESISTKYCNDSLSMCCKEEIFDVPIHEVMPDGTASLMKEVPQSGIIRYKGKMNIRFYSDGHCWWNCALNCWGRYSGKIWAENVDNGDWIKWHYIEVNLWDSQWEGRKGKRGEQTERSSNATFCSWDLRVDRACDYSAWAKFRQEDGYGFDIGLWKCVP